ncbi:MAG TPA: sigma-70 family RNA polymerase sigma factor [Longimicrobiales bacterium]|nr:sigma-70 family RNA polymerase sigma factor [Longimicrobiales bacterium]
MTAIGDSAFEALFNTHQPRVLSYLHRLSGDPELAADVTQEAFVRLYRRGDPPDDPGAWLITVATNLFRNARAKRSRRLRLLTPERGARATGDCAAPPDAGVVSPRRRLAVRAALDALPERDRALLLLCAEGYRYREIATALSLKETSVGTLLARAKRAFQSAFGEAQRAS